MQILFCRVAGKTFAALALGGLCGVVSAAQGHEIVSGAAPSGPSDAAPSGASQQVDGSLLVHAAAAHLGAWLSQRVDRFELEPDVSTIPALRVARGAVDLRVRRMAEEDARPAARMTLWLDVHVNGRFARSVLIGFRVRAHCQAWTANADLAPGTRLNTQLLVRREVDVASAGNLPWNGDPDGLVLRTRLLTGNFLVPGSAVPVQTISRGDSVQLRSRVGGVEIVAQARALQDANLSQRVRVRVDAANGPVLATVLEPGWVEIVQ